MTRIFSAILILLLGLLLPMQVSTQQKDPAMRSLEKVWSDAGKKSGMQLDDEAKLEIIKKYESLPTDAKKSIESGPWEPIENRIEGYLVAKKIAGAPSILSKKEVSDFSWYYIYYRTALIPIQLKTRTSATIETIMTKGLSIPYKVNLERNRETSLLIPAREDYFSIRASSTEGMLIWTATGLPSSGDVVFPQATSKGCEIYVNSEPDKGTIYFNDSKYYRLTNTSSVRDPGKWRVVVKKEAYQPWKGERALEKGEMWVINANLVKIMK